jgi:GNAT superfamily N-acetyltransferase
MRQILIGRGISALASGFLTSSQRFVRQRQDMVFSPRIAEPTDFEVVSRLLFESYSSLLAADYDSEILSRALPYLTKANPTLLASGTYYVVEREPNRLVGCGGWTAAEPGSGTVIEGEAHVRHVATHPDWVRRGVGTSVLARCFSDAKSRGIHKLHCLSTLNAECFYRAAGFIKVRPIDVRMGPSLSFPGTLMSRKIG